MKLIKKLGWEDNNNGTPVSWGLFLCEYCGEKVKRRACDGKKQKSCGYMKKEHFIETISKQKNLIKRGHFDLDIR